MEMVTLASSCNADLSQTLSLENSPNLRDAISSYLNGTEETFVHRLSESHQRLNFFRTTPHGHLRVVKKNVEEGEIDVFGAEKYFNGGIDEENAITVNKSATRCQLMKDENVDRTSNVGPKSQARTSNVHSESSWNSQAALLPSIPRNQPSRKMQKVQSKRFLASLGCSCYCKDKNSVDIDEHLFENGSTESVSNGVVAHGKAIAKKPIKTVDLVGISKSNSNSRVGEEIHCKKSDEPRLGLNGEGSFSFPTLNCKVENLPVEKLLQEEGERTARKSLEVFGSPILVKGQKTLNLERRLTMLSWDAIPRAAESGIPSSSNGMYNDTESDASSDLFEIESFSNNANPFFARQASDGISSCVSVTPTTCYAPSEASIEWSEATASAADFSALSDSEELIRTNASTKNPKKMVLNAKATPGKEMQRRRPGILSGCHSHKAVGVAGDAYIPNGKVIPDSRRPHGLNSFGQVTRFQAESKFKGYDFRPRQHAFDMHSASHSHSGPISHLLYIQ